MNIFEMAKKYYPRLWDEKRLRKLYEAGKITHEEYICLTENVDK